MTQPDGWQSPYDPPQQSNNPGQVPGASPAPERAGGPAPYQQPQPYQQGPYQQPQPYQQPYQQNPYQQAPTGQVGPYQPQPPYGAPYGYTAPLEKNALGVWSLVLGIVSVVMLFSCGVGFLAAIPALITGYLSRRAQKDGLADNSGLALGGIITAWVTIGITLLVIIGLAVLFSIPEFREGFFSETSSTSSYEY